MKDFSSFPNSDSVEDDIPQRKTNHALLPSINQGRNSVMEAQNQILETGGFSNCARLANQQLAQFPAPQQQQYEDSNGFLLTPNNHTTDGNSCRNDQLYHNMKRLEFNMKDYSNTPSASMASSQRKKQFQICWPRYLEKLLPI